MVYGFASWLKPSQVSYAPEAGLLTCSATMCLTRLQRLCLGASHLHAYGIDHQLGTMIIAELCCGPMERQTEVYTQSADTLLHGHQQAPCLFFAIISCFTSSLCRIQPCGLSNS